MDHIARNCERIREQMGKSALNVGRSIDDITLMAVTKQQPLEYVEYAYSVCNITCFGENRIQEATEKYSKAELREGLHIIGHLQSNKVKKAVELCDWIDSVDSPRLLERIERQASEQQKVMKVLFEYHTSGEESKAGFRSEEELFACIEAAGQMKHVEMRGLMTLGPLTEDERLIRTSFSVLRELYYKTIKLYPEILFDTISMGMSSDYPIAIEEGATLIRLGSALFGKRDYA